MIDVLISLVIGFVLCIWPYILWVLYTDQKELKKVKRLKDMWMEYALKQISRN